MWPAENDLPGQVIDPVGYHSLWVYLAFGLLGLAVFCSVVWMAVRTWRSLDQPEPEPAEPPPPPAPKLTAVEALALIDQIEWEHRTGRLTNRAAHHRLSGVVRACATDQLGLPAKQMTLADLERLAQPQLGQVAGLVRFLYPAQFGLDPANTVEQAAGWARSVVLPWV